MTNQLSSPNMLTSHRGFAATHAAIMEDPCSFTI